MNEELEQTIRQTPPEPCPSCGKDLRSDPIPKKDQWLYGQTHFSNRIGIYDMDKDMTVEYQCPFCKHRWPR